jgi:hypothetical protein
MGYLWSMIRHTSSLDAIQRRYAREVLAGRSYLEAVAVFEALWRQALLLNSEFPGDWHEDIAGDIAVARAVNGLPPAA